MKSWFQASGLLLLTVLAFQSSAGIVAYGKSEADDVSPALTDLLALAPIDGDKSSTGGSSGNGGGADKSGAEKGGADKVPTEKGGADKGSADKNGSDKSAGSDKSGNGSEKGTTSVDKNGSEKNGSDNDKSKSKNQSKSTKPEVPDVSWEECLEASKKSYAAGKLKESAIELDTALAAAERLKVDLNKANTFLQLGEQYMYLKQFERAKALMEEGLKMKRKIPGFKSVSSANALDNLAQAYSRTGNLEGASKFEQESLATYESLHKTETHDYAIAMANHANTLRQLKQYKEAEQFFAKAVAAQQKVDKGDSIELAKVLLNAGGLYCEMDRLPSAKRLIDRASKITHAKLSPEHPLYKLSIKSERVYEKKFVDDLLKKDPNPVRPDVAAAVIQLATLYEAEGDFTQGAAAYRQAVKIQEKLLPPDSPELKKVRDDYAACLKKLTN